MPSSRKGSERTFYRLIGARGFEPPTSCAQGRRANQAALRPDKGRFQNAIKLQEKAFDVNPSVRLALNP